MPDLEPSRFNRDRMNRTIAIQNGAVPSTEELLSGMPFLRESDELDAQAFIDDALLDLEVGSAMPNVRELIEALQAARLRFDRVRLARAVKAAEKAGSHEIAARMLVYHAFRGGMAGVRSRLAAMSLDEVREHKSNAPFHLATAIGLATSPAASMERARNAGFKALDQIIITMNQLRDAAKAASTPVEEEDDDDIGFMRDVLDDRAELRRTPAQKRSIPEMGVVVIPEMAPATTSHRKDVVRAVFPIVGVSLPLVPRPDLRAMAAELDRDYPWAAGVTAVILRDLAARQHVYIRPTLLVSPPGMGKSSYARALLEATGLMTEMVPLGGVADGAVMGTSSQWGSARPSNALALIARVGHGNVGMILDEVDKSKSSQNGSAVDALLPFLERSTSMRMRDPALDIEVNLSWVSWLATANDLDAVPGPLRDRMRVLRMPLPGPEHVGDVARRIIAEIVEERGEHPGFVPPLAQDELELARDAWRKGSLRQLRRIVETIVEVREQESRRTPSA